MSKLYRSHYNRTVAGVLGGLSDYTKIDASFLRILFVLGVFFGFGVLLFVYMIWIIIVPSEKDVERK
ncbi:membrane protein [Bacillus manliponensis]|uniref:Membrane protein n=1 Tax=Bacillus manliponensis TaxID=574376 RepID=A0A073K4D5_9BACI|nr:PspC domain-containing protein [Bacillus manliponensis]KEK21327.1 membrane protein [Bacillus manliponensis]